MLVWEPGGFMLYYKRLESGTFQPPVYDKTTGQMKLNYQTLLFMIQGIRLEKIIQRKRHQLSVNAI